MLSEIAKKEERKKPGGLADPCVMVIFGATGDLTKRKLSRRSTTSPSSSLLSREFAVIGIARSRDGRRAVPRSDA